MQKWLAGANRLFLHELAGMAATSIIKKLTIKSWYTYFNLRNETFIAAFITSG